MVVEVASMVSVIAAVLSAGVIAFVLGGYLYFTWHYGYFESQGVPVEKPRFFKGTLEYPWIERIEEQDLRNYKKFGRIYGVYEGRVPSLHVAEPSLLQELLVDGSETFPNRRSSYLSESNGLAYQFLQQMRAPKWRRLRQSILPFFDEENFKQLGALVEEHTKRSLNCLTPFAINRQAFDARRLFSIFTLEVIASCAFGVEVESLGAAQYEDFVSIAGRLFTNSPLQLLLMYYAPKLLRFSPPVLDEAAFTYFMNLLQSELKKRSTCGKVRNDFIQFVLRTHHGVGINESNTWDKESVCALESEGFVNEVMTPAILFLFAGHETTATAISLTCYCLALNPEVQNKLVNEIDDAVLRNQGTLNLDAVEKMQYLEQVVYETLRMYPPLVRTERTCIVDGYKLGEVVLKKDMVVGVPIYAIHHDPSFYPEPHVFNPERFSMESRSQRPPHTFLPFGAGSRSCIGEKFALLQIKLVLAYLLRFFRVTTSIHTEIPLEFNFTGLMLQPKSVTLMLEQRKMLEAQL